MLNLFLALLLSNFGSSNLSAPTADNDTNKIAEAIDRIARFVKWIKRNVLYLAKMMRAKLTNQISDQAPGEGPSNSWKEGLYPIRSLAVCAVVVRGTVFQFCFSLYEEKEKKKKKKVNERTTTSVSYLYVLLFRQSTRKFKKKRRKKQREDQFHF